VSLAPNLLAINPGSASTKFGLYHDAEPLLVRKLEHSRADLAACGSDILAQLQLRLECLESELEACGMRLDGIEAVVGRGGLLRPVPGGTYHVNDEMLAELRLAKRGHHAANLERFSRMRLHRGLGYPPILSIQFRWMSGSTLRGSRAALNWNVLVFHTH